MKKLLIIGSALALTTACQSISDRQMQGAAAGAVIGAGVGILAGGDDGRNAAIGAVVGAIAGGAVGDYMDKQEEKLRQQTAGTGIGVERVGDKIALTMPSGITFPVNQSTIQPGFQNSLNDVAATLVEYPSTAIDVVGHASADGDDQYNMNLSIQRANSVQSYLNGRGVQSVRMNAVGMGENAPIADNTTEEGRAANRRVEILLTPVVES